MAIVEAAINICHVNLQIGDRQILQDIDGTLPTGKITALVGPSGAGKSTFFQLCNGMRSPSQGDIYIHGKAIDSYLPTDLRRMVGTVLQQATMMQGSAYDNLSLPLKLSGKDLTKSDAEELLRTVNLDAKFLQQPAKELSGGQKQKLSIARTLVNQPPILLLDEITSSLDQVSAQEIEQLILKINKTYDTTIIWITHSLEQAKRVADFVWVMMDGQIVEQGPVSVLDEPKTEKARRFIKGEQS